MQSGALVVVSKVSDLRSIAGLHSARNTSGPSCRRWCGVPRTRRMGPGNDDPDRVRTPHVAIVHGPPSGLIRSNSLKPTLLPSWPELLCALLCGFHYGTLRWRQASSIHREFAAHQTLLFQLIQKTFRGPQIEGVESFGESVIYRLQDARCLVLATLMSPQMSEARCRSQLPSQGRLFLCKI